MEIKNKYGVTVTKKYGLHLQPVFFYLGQNSSIK